MFLGRSNKCLPQSVCGISFTTDMFGEFVKRIREQQRLGLREFCLENGHDPSNWSKIEREILAPPKDEQTLRGWAKDLGLKDGSEDWLKFFEYAAVDAGRIPDYVLKDEKLVAQLPAFFRTLSGQKPSREDLETLFQLIKSANRP
jgi:transcriptional regulator with XRE-family HTH domain